MNPESLIFNQQVGAVIRYTVKPEATRAALKKHPLFNLVATCPTHLTLEQSWFNFDRDLAIAKASRVLVQEPQEVRALFEALTMGDLKDEAEQSFLKSREIAAVLATKAAGSFQVLFPPALTQAAIEALIDDQVPFQRLNAHLKDMATSLRQEKAGGLISAVISYSPAIA